MFPQESKPASSHHQAPETQLALAQQLYGCSPDTSFMLSVQGDDFTFGKALTCAARECVETAAMLLARKLGL